MLKILFYHANDTIQLKAADSSLFLGVSALYLKTYIDINYKDVAKNLDWLVPLQHKITDSELVDIINTEQPDVFCTSHYIWNNSFLFEQIERIKDKIPATIKIIVGGPSVDVNINPTFFEQYSFVDYAIYGSGEQAFADLVAALVSNKKLIKFNTSNVAWTDSTNQKQIVADFKYVAQSQVSPFLINKELFTKMVEYEQSLGVSVIVPYDLTRGCPYSCTFCDWNSGLSNKVTRRKGSYVDEIDLFQKLKINNIYLSDANVGQYQEDVDMIAYLAEKNIKEGANFKIDGNFSKLRKENNLKIYHLMGKGNLVTELGGFTFSVQDINPEVLKNIDRPDVGWNVHVDMIREIKNSYPDKNVKMQLIVGLPGQTVLSLRNTLKEVCKERLHLQPFVSELLAASPAALEPKYQNDFNFTYSNSERFHDGHFFKSTFVESCFSFSKYDMAEMVILTTFYCAIMYFREKFDVIELDVESTVDDFLSSIDYQRLLTNLWDNWNNDKFYYTVNLDGTPEYRSACQLFGTGAAWINYVSFLKFVSRNIPKEKKYLLAKNLINKDRSLKSIEMRHYV